jgi:hypothetical protein
MRSVLAVVGFVAVGAFAAMRQNVMIRGVTKPPGFVVKQGRGEVQRKWSFRDSEPLS